MSHTNVTVKTTDGNETTFERAAAAPVTVTRITDADGNVIEMENVTVTEVQKVRVVDDEGATLADFEYGGLMSFDVSLIEEAPDDAPN